MNDMILSKRLKLLRENNGYLQKYVADKLGVRSNTLSGYENGTRSPDPEMIKSLAKLYNVTTDYLLGYSDQPHLTEKEETDIAKRLAKFKEEIEQSDGLAFDGEPMSEEARESLIESMEHIFRTTQRINKKYIPKKYRDD